MIEGTERRKRVKRLAYTFLSGCRSKKVGGPLRIRRRERSMSDFFRVRFGVVSRADGHSAAKRCAYQTCGLVIDHLGRRFDFTRKAAEHALPTIMLAPDHAPAWCSDAATVWTRAAAAERRIDAQEARTVDFSMPRAVPRHLWGAIARYVYEPLRAEGMVLQVDIHDAPASDGGRNVNVHGLASLRRLDGNGFARKKERCWNDMFRERGGRAVRDLVAARLNSFCQQHGIEYQADARPNADRGRPAAEPELPKWNFESLKRTGAPTAAFIDLEAHRARRREWEAAAAELGSAKTVHASLRRRQLDVGAPRIEPSANVRPNGRDRRAAALRAWQGGDWIRVEALSIIAAVRIDNKRGCLWIDLKDGSSLIDTGDSIRLRGAVTWAAAEETAAATERHGWKSVRVFGSPAYRDAVAIACALRGIPVTNHALSMEAEATLKAKLAERASVAPEKVDSAVRSGPAARPGGSRIAHLRMLQRLREQASAEEPMELGNDLPSPRPSFRPPPDKRPTGSA